MTLVDLRKLGADDSVVFYAPAASGGADAPTVSAIAAPVNAGSGTSSVVTMPAHATGDLLFIVASGYDTAGAAWTANNDFVQVDQDNTPAFYGRSAAWAKVATSGSETCTITKSASDDSCLICFTIQDHGVSDVATDIKKGTSADGQTTAPAPPAVTPGSDGNYLVIAHAIARLSNATWSMSAIPADYTEITLTKSVASSSAAALGAAYLRTAIVTNEQPGTFTLSNQTTWLAQTYAIPPA